MITDRTLAQLRTAAALALLVPGVSVDVTVEGRPVVHAGRMPLPDVEHPALPVCAFHRSVARAHDLRRQGTRVEMVGIDGDLEPQIDLLAGDHVRLVPGGVVRLESEMWLHVLALSLPVERVGAVAREVAADTGIGVDLHADRSLDVTVLVTDTPGGDLDAARAAIDTLERVAARATVDAFVELVQPATTDWDAFLTTRRP